MKFQELPETIQKYKMVFFVNLFSRDLGREINCRSWTDVHTYNTVTHREQILEDGKCFPRQEHYLLQKPGQRPETTWPIRRSLNYPCRYALICDKQSFVFKGVSGDLWNQAAWNSMAISSWSSSQGCHWCLLNCGESEEGRESGPYSDQHSLDSVLSRFYRVQKGQEPKRWVSKERKPCWKS